MLEKRVKRELIGKTETTISIYNPVLAKNYESHTVPHDYVQGDGYETRDTRTCALVKQAEASRSREQRT